MGSEIVKTPNMDSLANSGILFENGYVPENHCRPALQSLVNGILPNDYNKKIELIKQQQRQTQTPTQTRAQTMLELGQTHEPARPGMKYLVKGNPSH